MAFSRTVVADSLPEGDALTSACAGIGMVFAAKPTRDANVEDTLIAASIEGMDRDDLRMLAVLVTWLGVHHERVNADRLIRAVGDIESARVRVFWAAIAVWLERDRRFAKLAARDDERRIDLLTSGTEFQVRRRGEDVRFAGGPLRVPAGVLRERDADVMTPGEVAKVHRAYRWRVIIGPSYRADLWAANEADPNASTAELARKTYASFASAWQVKRDSTFLTDSARRARRGDRGELLLR